MFTAAIEPFNKSYKGVIYNSQNERVYSTPYSTNDQLVLARELAQKVAELSNGAQNTLSMVSDQKTIRSSCCTG